MLPGETFMIIGHILQGSNNWVLSSAGTIRQHRWSFRVPSIGRGADTASRFRPVSDGGASGDAHLGFHMDFQQY